ncbi:hypothetical protein UFOVP1040_6 [uncultured Caudovirales phage]|uniref:Uncharacterized protein n=1 Tax=uncultured Caudovirales phage TaxID=2100421 RepID=A0A6J5QC05_9CAUD|nr:hypothetical protein UFOVP1040_6 [uncultured Caudovirales phage]
MSSLSEFGMDRLDNVQVYENLTEIADAVEALSHRAWSVTGATALQAVAALIRRVATAHFTHTMIAPQEPVHEPPPGYPRD